MSTSFLSSQSTVPTCGETQCNGRGTCVVPPDGGADLVCNCKLGYKGDSCESTVNGALSVPLTLSVLGILIGIMVLAFAIARFRRNRKKKRRRHLTANRDNNIAA